MVAAPSAEARILARMEGAIARHSLAGPDTPVLLMVSGGSDSTALAYLACELERRGIIGPLAALHVNHRLRGADADADARFVAQLAEALGVPLFSCEVDVGAEARRTGENVEAVARRERYRAADEALASLCRHCGVPLRQGRIFTAHTADDRVENFYMRSIVGTGPGGFRAMRYRNGAVARPLLDVGRESLRAFLHERAQAAEGGFADGGMAAGGRSAEGPDADARAAAASGIIVRDGGGALWREDATNAHTDRFRAYVRHEIVPRAKERNPRLLEVLSRAMNLVADEDDMLEDMAASLEADCVSWLDAADRAAGCVLAPRLGVEPRPLARRVAVRVLGRMLGLDARIETASVDAVLAAYADPAQGGAPCGGYVANIQGDVAVSANKHGVRLEPMRAFRARRKRL